MARLTKLSADEVWQIIGFLSRVVPRGEVEADQLAGLIGRLQKLLTDLSTRA